MIDMYAPAHSYDPPSMFWSETVSSEPPDFTKNLASVNQTQSLTCELELPLNPDVSQFVSSYDIISNESNNILDDEISGNFFAPITNVNELENTTSFIQNNKQVEEIANQRINLLAIKFASDKNSCEILARLDILNKKLLEISPRVKPEQVIDLERANELLESMEKAREERALKFGK